MENTSPPTRNKLFLGLGLGGVGLLLLSCCCLGIGGSMGGYFLWFAPEKNDKVTQANYDALHYGMTLAEIEAQLGPAKPTSSWDVHAAYWNVRLGGAQGDVFAKHEQAIEKEASYRWRNDEDYIIVMFDKSAKDGGKAAAIIYVQNSAKPPVQVQKGSFPTYP